MFSSLSDLELNDIWYEIDNDIYAFHRDYLYRFMNECSTREDTILLAAAVEISEQFVNMETNLMLQSILKKTSCDFELNIFLISEMGNRPKFFDSCHFLPFFDDAREDNLSIHAAKVILFNDIPFGPSCIDEYCKIDLKKKSEIVRIYLATIVFLMTKKMKYYNEFATYSGDNLELARVAKEMKKLVVNWTEDIT